MESHHDGMSREDILMEIKNYLTNLDVPAVISEWRSRAYMTAYSVLYIHSNGLLSGLDQYYTHINIESEYTLEQLVAIHDNTADHSTEWPIERNLRPIENREYLDEMMICLLTEQQVSKDILMKLFAPEPSKKRDYGKLPSPRRDHAGNIKKSRKTA